MKLNKKYLFLTLMSVLSLAFVSIFSNIHTTPTAAYADETYVYDLSTALQVDLSQYQDTYDITQGGTYLLTGTLNGGLYIKVPDTDTVQLVMSNAHINSSSGPAIYGLQAGQVILILAEDTVNSVSDGIEYALDEEGANAAIYMETDLVISGNGSLEVTGQTAHGILSKDSLSITGGELAVTAVKDGLRGKNSVYIQAGNILINAGSDGIASTNTQEDKGAVRIDGGNISIIAQRDGIQAESSLLITGGNFDIFTGSGGNPVQLPIENLAGMQGNPIGRPARQQGMRPQQTGPDMQIPAVEVANDSSDSMKGLKANTYIMIQGGSFNLNTQDDAIHSNDEIIIEGGDFNILTDDDGLHAEENLLIKSGNIIIVGCYEGLEAKIITIDGGNIDITSSDDGINAADGTSKGIHGDAQIKEGVWVVINGGKIKILAGFDAIDSNGTLTINGGEVDLTSLSLVGGDAAIDTNGGYTYVAGQVTTNDGSEKGNGILVVPDHSSQENQAGFPHPGKRP